MSLSTAQDTSTTVELDDQGMGYMAELVGGVCVLSNGPGSKLAFARVPAVTISGTKTHAEAVYLKKVDRFTSGLALSVTWVR